MLRMMARSRPSTCGRARAALCRDCLGSPSDPPWAAEQTTSMRVRGTAEARQPGAGFQQAHLVCRPLQPQPVLGHLQAAHSHAACAGRQHKGSQEAASRKPASERSQASCCQQQARSGAAHSGRHAGRPPASCTQLRAREAAAAGRPPALTALAGPNATPCSSRNRIAAAVHGMFAPAAGSEGAGTWLPGTQRLWPASQVALAPSPSPPFPFRSKENKTSTARAHPRTQTCSRAAPAAARLPDPARAARQGAAEQLPWGRDAEPGRRGLR